MMKKIWSAIVFALFGGMVFVTSPARAGFLDFASAFFDRLGNMEASLLTDIPGVSSIICYFGDCDPDLFKQAIEDANDESKLRMLYETINIGGCSTIEWVYEQKEKFGIGDLDGMSVEDLCDEITIAYNNLHNIKPTFPATMEEYLQDYQDACWFCEIFKSMYEAINKLVTNIFNKLAESFLSLMGMGIAFLILFKVGRLLVQLQEVDVMQFLNDLFKPLGRAIIATAFLGATVFAGSQTVFYIVTNPIMDVSLKLGEKVLETTLGEVLTLHQQKMTGTQADRIVTTSLQPRWNEIDSKYETENNSPPNSAMGEATRDMLIQWLKSVSSSFIVGIAMGGTFIKIGLRNFFSGGFSMFLSGLVMWLGFWILYLTFPFKIVDAFVRLAFVLTLMPLWIVLWVFPVTQQYTKRAFEMLLSSCFLFITLSIMIAIVLMLINHVVPNQLFNDAGEPASRSQFFGLLLEGRDHKASKYVSIGCGMIMNAIAFTAMGGSLLMAASSIANSFIGGGGNIQTNVGNGVAATTARVGGLGVSMAKAGGKVAWWGGTKLAEGGKKLKDAYQSRRASSGGRFSGNSGGGSGGGAGGGGGGGTPPLNGGPTVIRGARGEQGAQGAQGERGERGPQGGNGGAHGNPGGGHGGGYDGGHRDSSSAPIPQSMQTEAANRATSRENEWYDMRGNAAGKNALLASVGANERHALVDMDQAMQRGERDLNPYRQSLKEGILADMHASIAGGAGVDEGTVNKALARENELQALRGNPTAKNALLASLGKRERQALIDMDKAMLHGEDLMPHRQALAAAIAQDTSTAALPNPLADVSPERMRAIEGLAKDEKSISNLRSLSQDMSFIEQSKTLNREDFVQAVKNHEWQVEPKRMQAYATDIYDQKNSQDYVEDRTRELLHDTYFGSAATRSTAEELASVMVKGFRGGSQDKAMSKALNELADQVTEAQTHKLTKES